MTEDKAASHPLMTPEMQDRDHPEGVPQDVLDAGSWGQDYHPAFQKASMTEQNPTTDAVPASTLYFNGRAIWHNPSGMGHAFVKLRKDVHEEALIKRMYIRRCLQMLRARLQERP